MARVNVINETTDNTNPAPTAWTLWLQWCLYLYDSPPGTNPLPGVINGEYGYRFIWKRPQSEGGSLQAARGQARIPSLAEAEQLFARARAAGWGTTTRMTLDRPRTCALRKERGPSGRARAPALHVHVCNLTTGSSWPKIRYSTPPWLGVRSATPWPLPETADSVPCAGPRFAAGLLLESTILLFWCRNAGCRWLGRFACLPVCGRG